jgi:acetyl-CoA C-acetyltransferase
MGALGRAAATRLGRPLAALSIAEVYSCFPAAVRVQQRELGLDPDGTPTVTGGMSFAGGPFNNFVLNGTATVAGLLRAEPSELGLITTVSGMLSKPGLAVWSASPPDTGSFVADLAGSPEIDTPSRPVAPPDSPGGPAVVASFTVTYDAADPLLPARTAIVADLPDGTRTAATCDDAAIALSALSESLIGRTVHIVRTSFSL